MPFVQATPFAIRGFNFSAMIMLAIGAVGLSMLRILVVVEVALQRYAVGLTQAGAVVLFLVLCKTVEDRTYSIAELHTIIVWGFLIVAGATLLLVRIGFFQSDPLVRAIKTTWRKHTS
jgi:hypothetical protein